jgi:mxaJ protein
MRVPLGQTFLDGLPGTSAYSERTYLRMNDQRTTSRPSSRVHVRVVTAIMLAFAIFSSAFVAAQTLPWELRACADPNALPFSGREEAGFENEIASILAEAMGADISYDWVPFSPDIVNIHLREGTCDVLLGVPDGFRDLTNTVGYYRSPYVFVTRRDAPFDIASIEDPILGELTIGMQDPGVPPHDALLHQGWDSNVVQPRGDRPNPPDRVLQEVADGEIDVGIIWGPLAGYFAPDYGDALRIQPITPDIAPPFLPMSFAMTMAVRPGDDQLRDRLNIAIADRWDEIQAVLASYGVPLVEGRPPSVSIAVPADDADRPALIGVIGPSTTGATTNLASTYDLAGDAARNGAVMAEQDGHEVAPGAADTIFRHAVTPSADAAERAAERMIATEGVNILVGGVGDGQAERLARVAEANDILFLNSGSIDLTLRERCYPTTLHVEAGADAYLDVLVDRYADAGVRRWFVVHVDNPEGVVRTRAAEHAVARHGLGGEIVGVAAVPDRFPAYGAIFDAIHEEDADGVLLMVDPADQIAFIGQLMTEDADLVVAPLVGPVAQTRDYLAAENERTRPGRDVVRVVGWTPDRLEGVEASEQYRARNAALMQSSAFAGYQATLAALQAIEATGSVVAADLLAWLTHPDTQLASPKGPGTSFRATDRQLRQVLDVIEVVHDAEWRNTLDGQTGVARFLASVPDVSNGAEASGTLDAYDSTPQPICEAP